MQEGYDQKVRLMTLRRANLRGIIINMCDESAEIFQEQLDAFIAVNHVTVNFEVLNAINSETIIDEQTAATIEKAFGLDRGWLDQVHLELYDTRPRSACELAIPIVDGSLLCQILDQQIAIDTLKDDEHPHNEFVNSPILQFTENCIAYRVPDDAMFSPF